MLLLLGLFLRHLPLTMCASVHPPPQRASPGSRCSTECSRTMSTTSSILKNEK
ncbi:hypothetical protein PF005_g1658 [Phytophthora fragariae]|uniref:RxLR effector protein n=1 Tax=Phytophthora fragariae TaxID=53985 RepID=A0A6A3USP7_9STRA|nr:hypothetical protein PF003_g35117 [Phytophthora fragariae]KAE8948709.1 hypothetical protein PF009_g1713 [Phytophthora fragariae]KAE9128967.1 hypothetical protein PF007_g5090 [Phytophthora fragariae]KAE9154633.1 hypothetical protein PF006_g1356 [Phytophthora fragariae]KAE9234991.1 hypothetical protein PF005_g1658 [Phytophthora fragariae]